MDGLVASAGTTLPIQFSGCCSVGRAPPPSAASPPRRRPDLTSQWKEFAVIFVKRQRVRTPSFLPPERYLRLRASDLLAERIVRGIDQ